MLYRVRDLIRDSEQLITVKPNESIQRAVELMIEHEYSQLPVVSDDEKPIGMVTSDSILRVLDNFEVSADEITVLDAQVKIEPRQQDEDLFGVLNYLEESYALVIVDDVGRLCGIITHYDITGFFRQQVEDIINVQEIEQYLKDYVRNTLANEDGEVEQSVLDTAIEEITPSSKGLRRKFQIALSHYLSLGGDVAPEINQEHLEQAFSMFYEKEATRSFDKLTMYDYIELFLQKKRWSKYSTTFGINPVAIGRLLEQVRETRNDLAHFRDISHKQSEQLRFCKDWFASRQLTNQATFSTPELEIEPTTTSHRSEREVVNKGDELIIQELDNQVTEQETKISKDELLSLGIRYAPLAKYLKNQSTTVRRIELSLAEIENIIQGRLPISAYQQRLWWANNFDNPQAKQWLDAEWAISRVDTYGEKVTFERIKAGGKAHIRFYNMLLTDLRTSAEFDLREDSPTGSNWLTATSINSDKSLISLHLYFPHDAPFEMAWHILTPHNGDPAKSQFIFDGLCAQKDAIEAQLEEHLEWRNAPIDGPRAWEIALLYDGKNAASDDEHREWALKKVNKFYHVFEPYFSKYNSLNEAG